MGHTKRGACHIFPLSLPQRVQGRDWASAEVAAFLQYLMDLAFLVDLILQFNVAYQDSTSGKMVMRHSYIAKHYLRNGLFVDFMSSLPYQLFMATIALEEYPAGDDSMQIGGGRGWTPLIPWLTLLPLQATSGCSSSFRCSACFGSGKRRA